MMECGVGGKWTFDSHERATAEANRLSAEKPNPPDDAELEFILGYQDDSQDPDGWTVRGFAGWKAWIGEKQYGDVVTFTPDQPVDEVWPILREQYEAVKAEVEKRGHGELVPPES